MSWWIGKAGVKVFLSVITGPIVLAHLIDFLIRWCYVTPKWSNIHPFYRQHLCRRQWTQEQSRPQQHTWNNKLFVGLFVFVQGWVAGLLRPRPFLNKLSNALISRKFCGRHNPANLFRHAYSRSKYVRANYWRWRVISANTIGFEKAKRIEGVKWSKR